MKFQSLLFTHLPAERRTDKNGCQVVASPLEFGFHLRNGSNGRLEIGFGQNRLFFGVGQAERTVLGGAKTLADAGEELRVIRRGLFSRRLRSKKKENRLASANERANKKKDAQRQTFKSNCNSSKSCFCLRIFFLMVCSAFNMRTSVSRTLLRNSQKKKHETLFRITGIIIAIPFQSPLHITQTVNELNAHESDFLAANKNNFCH